MKWHLLVLFLMLCSFANAAPVLFDAMPRNNSFFGRGTVNFSVNASGSTFDAGSASLFVISEDAYINNEPWNNYSMQCSAYAQDSWNCSITLTFSIVASDTLELFYFEGTDSSGKGGLGNQNASLRFKIDRTPPSVTFVTPRNSSYVSGNVSVAITISDTVSGVNVSGIQFSHDNSTWSSVADNVTSWNSSAYADNTTVFLYIRAGDNMGNSNITSINVTTDSEKPFIRVMSPQDGGILKGSVQFSVNVSDIYSGINTSASGRVDFGGQGFLLPCAGGVCSYSIDTLAVPDGDYSAVFSITDIASNVNTSTISVAIKNIKPAIALAPSGGYVKGTKTINTSITNPNGTITNVSLKIEKGAGVMNVLSSCNPGFTLCSYDWNTPAFTDGIYTVTASAGNVLNNNITTSAAFTVDNTKPLITIDASDVVKTSFILRANIADTNHNSNGVNFTFNDNTIPMTCVPQGTVLFCEIDFNPSYLSDGRYASNVTAVDMAGNTFTSNKTMTLDSRPPEIRFVKIEPISSEDITDVLFTVSAEDKGTDVKDIQIIIDSVSSKNTIALVKTGFLWTGKVRINTLGGHNVGIYAEDFSQNSKTYGKSGYFYIGSLTCGDNVCQPYENYCICAADCSAPRCESEISCISGLPSCASAPVCGDGICSDRETCSGCGQDCGSCGVPVLGGTSPDANPSKNPLGIGNGSFSEFIASNPLLVGAAAVILIAAAVVLLKFRKPRMPKKEKSRPFILGDEK